MPKPKVLFVCTHNSARSQIAEGLLRAGYGELYEAMSAGTEPSGVRPLAIKAMAEIGIDISGHASQHVDDFLDQEIDYAVTVCDDARERCPYVPARRKNIHQRFRDPSGVQGSEAEQLAAFRAVRDEIKAWIDETFGSPQTPVVGP